jgi:hypothetical protein
LPGIAAGALASITVLVPSLLTSPTLLLAAMGGPMAVRIRLGTIIRALLAGGRARDSCGRHID